MTATTTPNKCAKVTVEYLVPYDTPPYDRYERFEAKACNIREVERDVPEPGFVNILFEADITGVPWTDEEEWIIRQQVTVFGTTATPQPDGWYLDRMAD